MNRSRANFLSGGPLRSLPLLVLVLATGCRNIEETRNPISNSLTEIGATAPSDWTSESDELAHVQFDDIPVPANLFYRNHRNESFAFHHGKTRVGRFVYWGRISEDEAAQQYLELMPKDPYNWSLKTGPAADSHRAMVFEKPGQRCEIRLSRVRPLSSGAILVTISVESS